MSDHPRPTRLSRLLSRCYPRELREQYADDIARFIDDARRDPRNRNNPFSSLSVAGSLTKDALLSLIASWRNDAPRPLRRWESDTSVIATFRSFSMETLLHDIRFALRGFIRRPAFTVVALLTLTLGIGGNSAIFTLVNAVLLAPLPYANPEQLVNIWGANETQSRLLISIPDIEDVRKRTRTFSEIGIVRTQSVNLTGGERPDRVVGDFVTAPSLRMLHPAMALGRVFTDEETDIGAGQQVVVLNYETWQSRFGGRKDMLGQTLILNGRPHSVIGVTAASYDDPLESDIWLPITSAPSRAWFGRGNQSVWAMGRLKPGFTLADGQKELASIAKDIAKENGQPAAAARIAVIDLRESLVGGSRFMIAVLFGAVIAILLIVCVNIANLQLVRASTRQREMSVRAALGANRGRLISQTLVESLLLSLMGGVFGIALGQVAVKTLVSSMPITFPLVAPLQLDAKVWIFSLGMAVLTGLLFGIPAALSGTKSDLQSALRARTEQASTRRFNVRNVLVVSELALCIVLLAVAGLFTRSLQSLRSVDAGFKGQNVLSA
ncbi:MAG: ABC transporter permease, partial [Gemmatimonadaceae bacterium]